MTIKKNIITLLTLITLTSCASQPANKEEVTTPAIGKYAFTENNLNGLTTKKKENKSKDTPQRKENKKTDTKADKNNKKANKDKGKPSDNKNKDDKKNPEKGKPVKKVKTDNKIKENTEYKKSTNTYDNSNTYNETNTVNNTQSKTENKSTKGDKPSNNSNKTTKHKPSNNKKTSNTTYKPSSNTTTSNKTTNTKPKENKPVVKEVSRRTIKETIPKTEEVVQDYNKFEGSCDKSFGSDGYKEYEIIKYSDGTEKKNLINSKDPVNDVRTCGAKVKPRAYDYTNEWDGVYRPNQLVYNNRERFFTPYEAGYHNDIQAGIDRNEVAAVTERTIDVNDGYSTYFAAHNTTIFEDIEKDLTIGDTILITDSYGNPGYYQVSDKYVYHYGEEKYGTPGYYYFYENTEEVIYLQTCVEGSATLLYIYTAVRV